MKLVLFERGDEPRQSHVGILKDPDTVIPLPDADTLDLPPQRRMVALIDRYESLRHELAELSDNGRGIRLAEVTLLPPLPRPGKILACIANYWEHARREPRPLNMFLKNPDAVIGPNGVIRLPMNTEPWIFMHEAELAIVLKGPSKNVAKADWATAVFGYTCFVDVSARGEGRHTWRQGSWIGKSFDTFAPLGPCIVTADEVPDPNDLHVRFWNNGQLRHDYSTDDMEHRIPELIRFASDIMTLHSGDLIACGTNHEGLGALQHGERVEIEIERIGRMALTVDDPLRRSWPTGLYMGGDSTNRDAVARRRPDGIAPLEE